MIRGIECNELAGEKTGVCDKLLVFDIGLGTSYAMVKIIAHTGSHISDLDLVRSIRMIYRVVEKNGFLDEVGMSVLGVALGLVELVG
jgi:lantibiotic modifying enzyme